MPVVGEFHSKYWKRQNADHRPPVLKNGAGGYPLWQAAVIGCLLLLCITR